MYSQLTPPILAEVIQSVPPADIPAVTGTALLLYVLLWATLMRALLVGARILPRTCARCGLRFERHALGERVCRCHERR